MLRTFAFAALSLAASTAVASAEPRHMRLETPMGVEVTSDDGTVLGRVAHVERNRTGRIVAAEVPGLEPADAPRAPVNVVADNSYGFHIASDRLPRGGGGVFESSSQERTR